MAIQKGDIISYFDKDSKFRTEQVVDIKDAYVKTKDALGVVKKVKKNKIRK